MAGGQADLNTRRSLNDFYAEIERLIRLLREEGQSEWATRVEDALRSGSTGSEVLLALRANLAALRRESACLSQVTGRLLNDLLQENGRALRLAGWR